MNNRVIKFYQVDNEIHLTGQVLEEVATESYKFVERTIKFEVSEHLLSFTTSDKLHDWFSEADFFEYIKNSSIGGFFVLSETARKINEEIIDKEKLLKILDESQEYISYVKSKLFYFLSLCFGQPDTLPEKAFSDLLSSDTLFSGFVQYNLDQYPVIIDDIKNKGSKAIVLENRTNSFITLLKYEFIQMVLSNLKLKQCAHCHRFFLVESNYDYCKITKTDGRTCRELKTLNNLPIYNNFDTYKNNTLIIDHIYRKIYDQVRKSLIRHYDIDIFDSKFKDRLKRTGKKLGKQYNIEIKKRFDYKFNFHQVMTDLFDAIYCGQHELRYDAVSLLMSAACEEHLPILMALVEEYPVKIVSYLPKLKISNIKPKSITTLVSADIFENMNNWYYGQIYRRCCREWKQDVFNINKIREKEHLDYINYRCRICEAFDKNFVTYPIMECADPEKANLWFNSDWEFLTDMLADEEEISNTPTTPT